MKIPSLRLKEVAVAAATPVAIVAAAGMVYQSSHAAFSGSTRNSGNDWSTGAVAITDDDAGSARFHIENMTPQQTETKCIRVTANVTVAGTVKAYIVNPVRSAQQLENYVLVSVKAGQGGTFNDCTGFVADSDVIPAPGAPLSHLMTKNNYGDGVGGWAVSPGTQTRTYQFTWKFETGNLTQSQVDQLQGARTGIDLQWELQTN